MLVLSRKSNERILIGENIVITVVRIGPNNVRLGIDAPRELNIVRDELVGVIQTEDSVSDTDRNRVEEEIDF